MSRKTKALAARERPHPAQFLVNTCEMTDIESHHPFNPMEGGVLTSQNLLRHPGNSEFSSDLLVTFMPRGTHFLSTQRSKLNIYLKTAL